MANNRKGEDENVRKTEIALPQCLLSESLGTLLLTFVATAPVVISHLGADVSHLDKVAPPGMLVMVLIYCLGNVSGAHINPAVTLAFALRGAFPWSKVLLYWTVQIAGAIAAASLLKCMFPEVKDLGITSPALSSSAVALSMEIMLTMMLTFVILCTAKEHRIAGPNAAIAVGATITFCGMIGSPVSGASMNPARSLGPALLSGNLHDAWIYCLGLFSGALISVVLVRILHGSADSEEAEKAQGQKA